MTDFQKVAKDANVEQLLFESHLDCAIILDLDGHVLAINRNGQHLFEIGQAAEVEGKEWHSFWPAESQEQICNSVAEARRGQASRFEAYCPTAKGSARWWEVTVTPIVDRHQGQCVSILSISRDITDKKAAEEKLKSTAEQAKANENTAEAHLSQLNALLDAVPVGIGYADTSGKLIYSNAANRLLWGSNLPLSENPEAYWQWQGWWADGLSHHGHPVQPDEWPVARVLRGEVVENDLIEIEPFDAPGSRKTVLFRATPVRNAEGSITGAVVAQLDITRQVEAETGLRESEAKFRTITNALPHMVWSTLSDGYHDYYNRQWYEYTGVKDGSTDGDAWNGMFHPEDQPLAWEKWQHSLTTGEDYEIEYRLRHRSGEYRWTLGRALPLRNQAGQIIRWIGTCTDIHEQKVAQEALKQSEEALRHADRRKDEFLAMLAHELRNPLAPISTAAELLRISAGDQKRVAHAGAIISRQVRHMTDLVSDLLDVSRVTRGLVKLDLRTLNLKDAVHAAIEQVRPLIERRNHTLSTRISAAPLWVRGDQTRLIQVIANLLNNAAKYTPPGGEIHLTAALNEDGVEVQVRDSGEGIDASLLPHIFELFTQAHRNFDRAQGGLGIGLALVKSMTVLHQGRISVNSEGAGRGSVFTVWLPTAQAPVEQERRVRSRESLATAGALHIAIVDDNVDAATTLASLLGAHGHSVSTFHTGEALLAVIEELRADVYILDIGLPGMSGYELAQRLRQVEMSRRARIYALTGYGHEHDRGKSIAAGFDEHFVKPVHVEALLSLLDKTQDRRMPAPLVPAL